MERPRDDTTNRDLLDHGATTSASIAADDLTKGLEQSFEAANLALKLGNRALEDKNEEVLKKQAIFIVKDKGLDRDINEFEARLYVLAGKKRDSEMYRRYFKNGLREVTQAEPRVEEPAIVSLMIKALKEDESKPMIGPLALEMGPRIQASLDKVVAAGTVLQAVEEEADFLDEKTVPQLRAKWIEAYVKLHSAVKGVFHDDSNRAESFFRPFRKARKKAAATVVTPVDGTNAPPAAVP